MDQTVSILVVEDDNDINQLLCKIIKKRGYHPQPAYSGSEEQAFLEAVGKAIVNYPLS